MKEYLPDITDEYGEPRLLVDKLFNGRLPDFHRLDVLIERRLSYHLEKHGSKGWCH